MKYMILEIANFMLTVYLSTINFATGVGNKVLCVR